MSPFPTAFPEAVLRSAAWTLVHFLWQGALTALAVAGALRLLRGASARLRYLTASIGLGLMALFPVVTAVDLATSGGAVSASPGASIEGSLLPAPEPAPATAAAAARPELLRDRIEPYLSWLLSAWLLGVALLTLAHAGGWSRVRRMRRECAPAPERWTAALERLAKRLGVARPVALLESARLRVPVVLGWIRPAILVPASTFTGLSPEQLEAVLAHELAHVRRHDYLMNLFQVAVETLLFYHPGVWWVSRQVRVERENCCDDLAVGVCGSPMAYARALADLERLRFGSPALALGVDGGSLLGRIRRLVTRGEEKPSGGLLAAVVAALVATLVAALGVALLFIASSSSAMPNPESPDGSGPAVAGEPVAGEAPATATEETAGEEAAGEEATGEATTPDGRWVDGESASDDRWTADEAGPDGRWVPKVAGSDDRWIGGEHPESGWQWSEPSAEPVLAWAGPQEDEARQEEGEGGRRRVRWWRESDEEWTAHAVEDLRRAVRGTPYEKLTDDDLGGLARHGFDPELIAVLVEAGITGASAGDLEDLARQGIDAEDLREYRDAGLTGISIGDLVDLAKHGVDGKDAREYRDAGLAGLSVDDMVNLAKHGVDGEDVRAFTESGYPGLSVDDLVTLAKHGVDGEDVREYREAGFPDLSIDGLVDLARQGIDGEDVRAFKEAGYKDLTVEQMTDLARQGIDGDEVREYQEAGYTDLSVDQMIALARQGIDGDEVRKYQEAGLEGLSVEQMTDLARQGIDGDEVREYREAGLEGLSVDQMTALARQGIDGDEVREYREAGLEGLSVDQMIDLARQGVDGDEVRDYQNAGYGEVTVDQMVDLARQGVDGDDLKELRNAGHDLSIEDVIRLARQGRLGEMDD